MKVFKTLFISQRLRNKLYNLY